MDGKLCKLRTMSINDCASVATQANNAAVLDNLKNLPNPYSLHDAISYIALLSQKNPSPALGIEVDGQIVGIIGIRLGEGILSKSAYIGFWLGQDFWGKGIMTEAIGLMEKYIRRNFSGLHRLCSEVFARNEACIKILEKNSFEKEGQLKDHFYLRNEYHDVVVLGKIL